MKEYRVVVSRTEVRQVQAESEDDAAERARNEDGERLSEQDLEVLSVEEL
jgi:uncharacterized protein (UPF0212 family)